MSTQIKGKYIEDAAVIASKVGADVTAQEIANRGASISTTAVAAGVQGPTTPGLTINNDDTTNNPNGIMVNHNGSGSGIVVLNDAAATGPSIQVLNSSVADSVSIFNSSAVGAGVSINNMDNGLGVNVFNAGNGAGIQVSSLGTGFGLSVSTSWTGAAANFDSTAGSGVALEAFGNASNPTAAFYNVFVGQPTAYFSSSDPDGASVLFDLGSGGSALSMLTQDGKHIKLGANHSGNANYTLNLPTSAGTSTDIMQVGSSGALQWIGSNALRVADVIGSSIYSNNQIVDDYEFLGPNGTQLAAWSLPISGSPLTAHQIDVYVKQTAIGTGKGSFLAQFTAGTMKAILLNDNAGAPGATVLATSTNSVSVADLPWSNTGLITDYVRRTFNFADVDLTGNSLIWVAFYADTVLIDDANGGVANVIFMEHDAGSTQSAMYSALTNPQDPSTLTGGWQSAGAGSLTGALYSTANVPSTTAGKVIVADSTGHLDQTFLQYNINFGSNKLSGVTDPSAAQDAATKNYVDMVALGLTPKAPVRTATTANVDLSTGLVAGTVIDGITLAAGDRVLVKDQTAAQQNGIYIVPASGAASRSTDMDSVTPIDEIDGAWVPVQFGTVNAARVYVEYGKVTTLGSDAINFEFYNPIAALIGGDSIAVSGSTVNIDLATVSGLSSTNPGNAAGQLQVNVDNQSIKINGSNNLAVQVADPLFIDGTGVNLNYGSGLNVVSSSLVIATLGVQTGMIADSAITTAKIADSNVTTAKIADANVTAAKLATSAVDLSTSTVTGTLPVGNGGTGLASPGTSGNVLTSNGTAWVSQAISLNRVKETKTLNSTDITNQYVDLGHLAASNSIVAFVGRLGMHEGLDYTVSSVGGVTRVTFAGPMATAGTEALTSGDQLFFTYQY